MSTVATKPVQKNERVIMNIEGLTHEGAGVGRVNGFALFVHGALPGEQIEAQVLKVQKSYGYAKMVKLIKESPDRVQADCAVFGRCGGCQLQHLDYEAQLVVKRRFVADSLSRIGGLPVAYAEDLDKQEASGSGETDADVVKLHPTLGMQEPWRYRNKAQMPFAEEGGRIKGGFYALGSHRVIDTDRCLIQSTVNDEAVQTVKQIAIRLGASIYDERTHRGWLRHVMVRSAYHTGEWMLVLVTAHADFPKREQWLRELRAAFPTITSICHNINPARTNVVFGEQTRVLWGREVIHDRLDDIAFAISARSFYQVNPLQTEVLYRKALDYANLTGSETVIDAYCGIGTISLFLARHAAKVYGVEIVQDAIDDAWRNAELNGIANVHFEAGPAEQVLPKWKADGVEADVIVVDPPRKGCDEQMLSTMLAMRPKRIVYVSCNPATLARDLKVLADGGYRVAEATPVDLFPHTGHVECVVGMQRIDT